MIVINSNGDIYIRVYFKPVTIMRKKISNWNIYKLQNIGIGSVIAFEVKYSIAITITSITRAKNPIVIKRVHSVVSKQMVYVVIMVSVKVL